MASQWNLADGARTAFVGHGVSDGAVILEAASRSLGAPAGASVAVTPAVLRAVSNAFREAFRVEADYRTIPASVEAALDDAVVWTGGEFDGGREVDAEAVLLPVFYHEFAGFTRAYCGSSRFPGAGGRAE